MKTATKASPEMLAKLKDEQAAIEQIRALYPHLPQKTIARQIRDHGFINADSTLIELLRRVGYRTLLSIYSVIRRYDRAQAKATANAAALAAPFAE